MSPSPDMAILGYPVLVAALERQLAWARDFARSGDVESAVDAIRDARAILAELRPPGAPESV